MERGKGRHIVRNDQAIASLSALSGQVEAMVPHLETAKETAEVIHSSMNDVVTTLGRCRSLFANCIPDYGV